MLTRPIDLERLTDAMFNEHRREAIEGPSYPVSYRLRAERLRDEYVRLGLVGRRRMTWRASRVEKLALLLAAVVAFCLLINAQ